MRRRTKVMDDVLDNEYSVYSVMTGIYILRNRTNGKIRKAIGAVNNSYDAGRIIHYFGLDVGVAPLS